MRPLTSTFTVLFTASCVYPSSLCDCVCGSGWVSVWVCAGPLHWRAPLSLLLMVLPVTYAFSSLSQELYSCGRAMLPLHWSGFRSPLHCYQLTFHFIGAALALLSTAHLLTFAVIITTTISSSFVEALRIPGIIFAHPLTLTTPHLQI